MFTKIIVIINQRQNRYEDEESGRHYYKQQNDRLKYSRNDKKNDDIYYVDDVYDSDSSNGDDMYDGNNDDDGDHNIDHHREYNGDDDGKAYHDDRFLDERTHRNVNHNTTHDDQNDDVYFNGFQHKGYNPSPHNTDTGYSENNEYDYNLPVRIENKNKIPVDERFAGRKVDKYRSQDTNNSNHTGVNQNDIMYNQEIAQTTHSPFHIRGFRGDGDVSYNENTEYDDENDGIALKSVIIALGDQFLTTRRSAVRTESSKTKQYSGNICRYIDVFMYI